MQQNAEKDVAKLRGTINNMGKRNQKERDLGREWTLVSRPCVEMVIDGWEKENVGAEWEVFIGGKQNQRW